MQHGESHLHSLKRQLRKTIRAEKGRHTRDELECKSASAVSAILANEHIVSAHVVAIYSSLPDEVDTSQAISELMAMGKDVYLPVVTSDTEMILRRYVSRESMHKGSFGIMEPDVASPRSEADVTAETPPHIDVIIVPGMAFDREGHRLGRGKGYYDRFLSSLECYKIGLCYDFQLFDAIPSEPTDVAMNEVICNR